MRRDRPDARRADVLDLHVSAFDADINGRRLMAASARRVAVFDLDDTLVRGDSFGQFTRGLSTGRVTAAPRSRCTFCGP